MESEGEAEPPYSTTTSKLLPLLLPPSSSHSSDPPGMRTPPLYTMASVPFRWEEEPGKPRPCTALIPFPTTQPKSLELPPCRLLLEPPPKIAYKTLSPSPTTVLDGPYFTAARPTNKFTSASFRFFRERQGSFDSTGSACSTSPEKGQLSAEVLAQKSHKGRAFFGSWRQGTPKSCSGKKEVSAVAVAGGGSFVHPSSSVDGASFWSDEGSNKRVKITKVRRNGSFSSLTQARPHFWAAVYEGFKQVIPWKNKKSKKESIV